ncbi:MAG: hypothetical protein ACREFL_20500 [Stellaceae bacterium]
MDVAKLLLVISCCVACAGIARAQDSPAPPKPTHEVPAMGGKPSALPAPKVIGLRANEVLLSRLKGAPVETAESKPIGPTTHALLYKNQGTILQNASIGSIDDVLIDPHGTVTKAIVKTTEGRSVNIAFSTLKHKEEPKLSFVTSLTPDALAKAAPSPGKMEGTITGSALLGREAEAAKGGKGGTLVDLVIELGNGIIDYAVIRSATPQGAGIGTQPRAVVWKDIRATASTNQPLKLRIDQAQLDRAPVFGLVAQQRPQDRKVERTTGATTPSKP